MSTPWHHQFLIFESKDLMGEYDKGYSWHSNGVWLRMTHQRSSIQWTSYPPIPTHHQSRCFCRMNKIAIFNPGNWYDSCRMTYRDNGLTYLGFWSVSLFITFIGDFFIFMIFTGFFKNSIFCIFSSNLIFE